MGLLQVLMVRALAKHLNFEAHFIQPADQSWGSIDGEGRWTGLVGQAGILRGLVIFHSLFVICFRLW